PVNTEYTLIEKDTTIGIYPLLFEYLGTRLQDETIQTVLGSFNCKKFLTQWRVSYRLLPPPFPPVELITTNDSIWIAPDNWIVQDIIPSNPIDLSLLGIDPFFIPGVETKLTDEIVSVENEELVPNEFALEQNYPNPFNPSTRIRFNIPSDVKGQRSNVVLKVYDLLGNEVALLVNEDKPAGTYNVDFDASNLPSGVYFYQLKAGPFIETKKMILLK
ncbi:MAG: T9SS type A sorting domain-containing protein, partial [Ignavibacteriaceae bacterium]